MKAQRPTRTRPPIEDDPLLCAFKAIDEVDTSSPVHRAIIAEALLGPVMWRGLASGYCRCPGEHLHNAASAVTIVQLDKLPSILCSESGCKGIVEFRSMILENLLGWV